MAKKVVDDTSLTSIANAIREKTGASDALVFPTGMVEAIAGIETGGGVDFSTIGLTKCAIGTTIGKNTFQHNLGAYPKMVIIWADDAETAGAAFSENGIVCGMSIVTINSDGTTKLRSGFATGTGKKLSTGEPTESTRTDMTTKFYPSASSGKYGICVNPGTSVSNPGEEVLLNNIIVNGKSGGGYNYGFANTTYNWIVFADRKSVV